MCVCVCVCLSVCLSVCRSVGLCVYVSVFVSLCGMCLFCCPIIQPTWEILLPRPLSQPSRPPHPNSFLHCGPAASGPQRETSSRWKTTRRVTAVVFRLGIRRTPPAVPHDTACDVLTRSHTDLPAQRADRHYVHPSIPICRLILKIQNTQEIN